MRFGFAVKVLGKKDIKSHDARRWQSGPHLRESIKFAHGVFDYLEEAKISMYRFSSDFAPYITHPDMPQFHEQINEARAELVELGQRARQMKLRLSFHPSQYIVLNSPQEKLVEGARKDFLAQAQILDLMELSCEAVVVTHVGGVYGEREAAIGRFITNFKSLAEPARRRLVLENDDVSFGVRDVLKIHEATGIRCIFDHQHHSIINPDSRVPVDAACSMLATWSAECRPKIHFSSPRSENRIIERRDKATGKIVKSEAKPLASQHADFINAEVFAPWVKSVLAQAREFDVMCEAKSKDLAVIKLRQDLQTQGLPVPIE